MVFVYSSNAYTWSAVIFLGIYFLQTFSQYILKRLRKASKASSKRLTWSVYRRVRPPLHRQHQGIHLPQTEEGVKSKGGRNKGWGDQFPILVNGILNPPIEVWPVFFIGKKKNLKLETNHGAKRHATGSIIFFLLISSLLCSSSFVSELHVLSCYLRYGFKLLYLHPSSGLGLCMMISRKEKLNRFGSIGKSMSQG